MKSLFDYKMTYLFLADILAVMICAIFAFLMSETILPNTVSGYISPFYLCIGLYALIYVITYIAKKHDITFHVIHTPRKTYIIEALLFLFIVGTACFRFGIIMGPIITITAFAIYAVLRSIYCDTITSSAA